MKINKVILQSRPEDPPDVINVDSSTVVRATDVTKRKFDGTFISDARSAASVQEHREWLGLVGYKVLARLDANTRSQVYLARRMSSGQSVAIKVTSVEDSAETSNVVRFRLEARLLSAFKHPNLVKAIGFGRVKKIHYMILEYVDGPNLKQLVEADGPLSIESAARAIAQAAEGLEYAHHHGVIHRDVKPGNLVLDPRGMVKVLDLGLARVPEHMSPSISLLCQDRLLGTPDYMPPEQILDCHGVDARADIYGLGCTLYYLLSGGPPFTGKTLMERLLKHQSTEAQSLHERRPEVPLELSRVCAKMMAKQPSDRYQSMGEVRAALAPWVSQPVLLS